MNEGFESKNKLPSAEESPMSRLHLILSPEEYDDLEHMDFNGEEIDSILELLLKRLTPHIGDKEKISLFFKQFMDTAIDGGASLVHSTLPPQPAPKPKSFEEHLEKMVDIDNYRPKE